MSTLPPNLPDARTAQRLLDILSELEKSLRMGRQTSGAATSELETRLANLQFENQRLRNTRVQAAGRLGNLIQRLQQQQLETTPDTPAAELTSISTHLRDHAA